MSPATKRRILVLVPVVLTGACASFAPNDAGWEAKPSHSPLPAYFVDVDGVTLQTLCGPRANWTWNGCVFRDYAHNRCQIYVEAGAPMWLAAHEMAHCAGFTHQ